MNVSPNDIVDAISDTKEFINRLELAQEKAKKARQKRRREKTYEPGTLFTNLPDLNEAVFRYGKKYIKSLRVWYILREFSKQKHNGNGCIPHAEALRVLSLVLKTKKSQNYKVLKEGNDRFWKISKHRDGKKYLHLYGPAKLAHVFGIFSYRDAHRLSIENCLLGDVKQVRANLFATIVSRYQYSSISRKSMQIFYDISPKTQRKYQKLSYYDVDVMYSYVIYDLRGSLDEILKSRDRLLQEKNCDPNRIRIKWMYGNIVALLYQISNHYRSPELRDYRCLPLYLRKCNKRLHYIRQLIYADDPYVESFLIAQGIKTFSENGEHIMGVPWCRSDVKMYQPSPRTSKEIHSWLPKENAAYSVPSLYHNMISYASSGNAFLASQDIDKMQHINTYVVANGAGSMPDDIFDVTRNTLSKTKELKTLSHAEWLERHILN